MRVLVFQHTKEEVPGSLLPWLEKRSLTYRIFHTYLGQPFPDSSEFDWLIVLGGPMNVDDTHLHPWLHFEKDFIKKWLSTEKPYLGICLGGQLLAQCLGGTVSKNNQREIGFWNIHKTKVTHPYFSHWPSTLSVFQWHQDWFTLPPSCQSLFSSEACTNQAFAVRKNVIGLQFHPEAEIPWILDNYKGLEKKPGEAFVQSKEECSEKFSLQPEMEKHFHSFLDCFLNDKNI